MNLALSVCIATASVFGAAMPAFPPEMDFLNQVPAEDADKVVDAVRQFALLQFAMLEWDKDIAGQLSVDPANQADIKARAETAKERIERVDKAYKVLLERYPKNARALNYYGEFVTDYRGDEMNGVRYWKESIANDPKLALPYNNLGINYAHSGQYAFAIENYNKAIELEPDNPDFKFNLAQLYLAYTPSIAQELKWDEAKVYKEGMKLSKAAAELKPHDFKLQQDYATNFYVAERVKVKLDWAEAAAAWQRARGSASTNEELFFSWLNEARAWINKPDKSKAEACLQEALKIIPDNKVASRLLADLRSGAIGTSKAE
ncbi:MAG: tetratricopeptide repeat protein [Candidatus Hydrogenedentes bacterium]|nr:tetratricopeptide repeat protein [Candidatus Hydrogenedentota bacterium]